MDKYPDKYKPTPVRLKHLKSILQQIGHDKNWSLSKVVFIMCEDHKLTKEYIKKQEMIKRRKVPFLRNSNE